MPYFDPKRALEEALSLGPDDAERAANLLRRISQVSPCREWAEARLALATRAYGEAEYDTALGLARSVFDSPIDQVPDVSRAVAAVLVSQAQDMLELPVDMELLDASIETCLTSDQPYHAAAGLRLRANQQLLLGERAAAYESFGRAADAFDRAGSMLGGPSVLGKIARLAIEDGRPSDACGFLDRGIAHLQQFPHAGFLVRGLEEKLAELRATLEASASREAESEGDSEPG